ncbi:3,4-dihydroxy 2-butanone 4-phosphate synthase/GTP cyclohydrolase II [Balneicella halophila]|uniref:Riboflavin biosynthesis protein RibBA n=1 Tax=Balneicella halophila TaxID=1537566 RepID=A0A7L4UNB2_BALHA|nr:3,4-dihydroxy 2-butanone 4-phosphate synthase/GTP cyclohydrolase II [Balneicella halophila]
MALDTIESAIEAIRRGEQIIIVDDEDRENEGDLVMAAEKVTPKDINYMIKKAGGLICMPIIQGRMKELDIDMMVAKNTDSHQTAFTVSVDAADCHTGISASERAHTIKTIIDPDSKPGDLSRPGHIFPLVAKPNGVLVRQGHTEAAVDMARLAGLFPAGVICEIIKEDGEMARMPELEKFAKEEGLKMISIADLIKYRRKQDGKLAERVTVAAMPTKFGEFKAYGYVNKINGEHHVALVKGEIDPERETLVRVHSECLTGDAFGSLRCDCGEQMNEALRRINEEGSGVLLYMRQEGRGIGLINKLRAYHLQDAGMDTVEANLALGFKADQRDYGIGAEILADLGVRKMRLMTNNPQKITGLEGFGLEIVDRVPIEMNHNEKNFAYMKTKHDKMGHLLPNLEKETILK